MDDLAELIFEDLGLPDLRPKASQEIPTEHVKFTEVRKKGPMSNLDKRRTIMKNLKRNARQGQPASGSMGEFKKYITRSLFFWINAKHA